mgnify:CR=1 FL=1
MTPARIPFFTRDEPGGSGPWGGAPEPGRAPEPPRRTRQPIFNETPGVVVALAAAILGVQALNAMSMGSGGIAHGLTFGLGAVVAGPDGARFLGGLPSWVLHVFVHGGWVHAIINTIALFAFGAAAARPFGRGPSAAIGFLAFFFTCAVFGAIAHELVHWTEGVRMVGASTAVSGLLAAAGWASGGRQGMLRLAAPWALINTVIAVVSGFAPIAIAWAGHVGGLVAGAALYPLFVSWFRSR